MSKCVIYIPNIKYSMKTYVLYFRVEHESNKILLGKSCEPFQHK